jgi:hypothetical protein
MLNPRPSFASVTGRLPRFAGQLHSLEQGAIVIIYKYPYSYILIFVSTILKLSYISL